MKTFLCHFLWIFIILLTFTSVNWYIFWYNKLSRTLFDSQSCTFRSDFGTQLDDFMIYINDSTGEPIYDAVGIPYTDGMYEVVLEPELRARSIIIQRPTGPQYLYITLCEVEAISGKCILHAFIALISIYYISKHCLRKMHLFKIFLSKMTLILDPFKTVYMWIMSWLNSVFLKELCTKLRYLMERDDSVEIVCNWTLRLSIKM